MTDKFAVYAGNLLYRFPDSETVLPSATVTVSLFLCFKMFRFVRASQV